jgi:hypothetical protein
LSLVFAFASMQIDVPPYQELGQMYDFIQYC